MYQNQNCSKKLRVKWYKYNIDIDPNDDLAIQRSSRLVIRTKSKFKWYYNFATNLVGFIDTIVYWFRTFGLGFVVSM